MNPKKKYFKFISFFLTLLICLQGLNLTVFAEDDFPENTIRIKDITGTTFTTFATLENNTVMSWGANYYGALGIGNTTSQYTPVTIPNLKNVKKIITNNYFTYALLNDGTVKSWGKNDYGQLGIGNTTNQSSPVTIPNLTGVSQIVAGGSSAYALLNDGTIKSWGNNGSGQLGIGNTIPQYSPVTISNLTDVSQIVASGSSVYAILNDGTVKSWGDNYYGQLGIGNTTNQYSPVTIPNLTGVSKIVAGFFSYTYAILNDGTVKSWGNNGSGQLGIGNTTNQSSPVTISTLTDVSQIFTGFFSSTYALLNDGTVKSWGSNDYGQLGIGNTTNQFSPATISTLTDVSQIVAGYSSAYAILNDGTVKSWGSNGSGQLGIGNTTSQYSPVTIPNLTGVNKFISISVRCYAFLNNKNILAWGSNEDSFLGFGVTIKASIPMSISECYNVQKITANQDSNFLITQNNTVKTWGYNINGDLGIGNTILQYSPVTIPNLTGVSQIVAGGSSAYAILNDGTVKSWGNNYYGQLGIGNTTSKYSPVIIPNLTGVSQIVASASSAYAILNDGTVKTWGSNGFGQLGIGNTTSQSSPVTIPNLTNVSQIVADYSSAYAILNDGTVKTWGGNDYGQLGIGNTTSQYSPVTIPNLTGVSQIVAGDSSAYAILNDGTVKSWGNNYYGQLGIGNTTSKYSPVIIPNLTGVTQIVSKVNSSYALLNDGTVKSWGQNKYGQLGIGNTTNQSSPIAIPNLTSITQITVDYNSAYNALGEFSAYALLNDGTVKSWGSNDSSQLGIGNTTSQYSPVTIPNLTDVSQIVADYSSAYAILNDGTVKSWGNNRYGKLGNGYPDRFLSPVEMFYIESIPQKTWGLTNTVTFNNKTCYVPLAVKKYAYGIHLINYFSLNGTEFTDSFTVSENGVYTVYEKDINGNEMTQRVTVDHIYTKPFIGSFTESFSDISISSIGIDMNIGRNYDSANTAVGPFGKGWSFSYSGKIEDVNYSYADDSSNTQTAAVGTLKKITMPGGKVYYFALKDGVYTAYDDHAKMIANDDGTYTLTTQDDIKYTFNASGYLASLVDKYNNTVQINFTDGNISSITDTAGRSYAIAYTNGKITSITDPLGRIVSYGYIGDYLTTVTDPMGNYTTVSGDYTTTYQYTDGVLTKILDPLSRTKEEISYLDGKVHTVTDPTGKVTTYAYNTSTNTMTETDSDNNATVNTYNNLNLLASVTGSDNSVTTYNQYGETLSSGGVTYTYNNNGDILTATYSNNSTEAYTYDDNGYLLTYTDQNEIKTFYQNNDKGYPLIIAVQKDGVTDEYSATANQSLFKITQFTYNSNGTVNTQTAVDGAVTAYNYISNENKEEITTTKNTVEISKTTNTYNIIGWLVSESTTSNTITTSMQYVYDLNKNTIRTKDQDNKYTRYVFDAYGHLVQQISNTYYSTYQDGLGATPVSYSYANTGVGERYVYNTHGDTLRYTTEDNKVTRYVYDSNYKLIQKIEADQYNSADDGLCDYSPTEIYRNSNVGYRYVYNTNGDIAREIAPDGKTTRYIYDTNQNLIQRIESDQYDVTKDGLNATTPTDTYSDSTVGYLYTYDTNHNQLREVAPNGGTTRFVYDSNNNLIQKIEPDQYNASCDGLNKTTPDYTYSDSTVSYRYTYNNDNVLLREIDPLGNTTRYVYNAEGKLIQQINTNQYNAANDGLNAETPVDTYSDNTVGYRYTYNASGSTATKTTPDGAVFTYNTDSQVTTEAYATGVTNTTAYNADGTVNTVTGSNNYSLTYGYDNYGHVTGYNEQFVTPHNYSYTYYTSSNIEKISEGGSLVVKYYYDSNSQMTREDSVVQNKTIAYTYDTNGNITAKKEYAYTTDASLTSHTPTHTFTYSYGNTSDTNQLTSYDGNAITYDSDGNMLTLNGWIYTWEDGKLVGATGNGKAAAYVYNASGIRTMKVLNGKVTNYTLDGNNIDSETTGTTTVNYVYDSNGSPVYYTLNGTAYYYERNLQGDITGIVDSTGTEVVKYTYDSWGKLLSITGSLATTVGLENHLRYRGYYYDTESGLYYLQSRYYNPEIGRFVSNDDPFFTDGQTGIGANEYAYCINNPVMKIDYWGYYPGNWFYSIESAAYDFAKLYNMASIRAKKEYGSAIYAIYKWGWKVIGWSVRWTITNIYYSYTFPFVGNKDSVIPNIITLNQIVSTVHTHANYIDMYGEDFSSGKYADKWYADLFKMNIYLVTPTGKLKYYNCITKKTTTIAVGLPRDPFCPF